MPSDPGKRVYPLRTNLREVIASTLGVDWHCRYAAHVDGYHDYTRAQGVTYGQLSAVKLTEFAILAQRQVFIYGTFNQFNTERERGTPSGKVAIGQLLRHEKSGEHLIVVNVHGFRSSYGKIDLPARFEQNVGINNLVCALLQIAGHLRPGIIVLGDLNYSDKMQALAHLAQQPCFGQLGGIILNPKFGIQRTRTGHYAKYATEPQADYMIASQRLADKVTGMWADPKTPSDHMAIFAEINF
jgi:hypothetical protein